ncbi:hypothetical protein ACFRCG_38795 [Embleya sp. NPDC056575]|uniref:hypothetical protein n=1 Tax=unclassified Embleya TaxID=2699296 RepID=UPI00368B294C
MSGRRLAVLLEAAAEDARVDRVAYESINVRGSDVHPLDEEALFDLIVAVADGSMGDVAGIVAALRAGVGGGRRGTP